MTSRFFKAYSHIGIRHHDVPRETKDGLAHGSDAVLTPAFLKNFPDHTLHTYAFTDPDTLSEEAYYPTLARDLCTFSELIDETCHASGVRIVVGGDHSITFASLHALLKKFSPQEICVIHIDTHGDIHLSSTSPSDNFHGMHLRPFFDTFDIPEIETLVPKKLRPTQLLHIGNPDLEVAEIAYQQTHRIRNITSKDFAQDRAATLAHIRDFIAPYRHVHVSFDIDSLSADLVRATGMPNPDGLSRDEVFACLDVIRAHPSASIDITEINASLPGIDDTARVAREIINHVVHM